MYVAKTLGGRINAKDHIQEAPNPLISPLGSVEYK